jgi:hypothetical protein
MSYDKQCHALADSFLSDNPHLRDLETRTAKLAQGIQSLIEDWITDWEDEDAKEIQEQRAAYEDSKAEHFRERSLEDQLEAADMARKRIREEGR